ncbi:hypothetical protein B5F76_01670 [Desulfovibrio sp. An276]|nr:hypothetical protein B5F76_01670 [Desulfovibrio sp. An276]
MHFFLVHFMSCDPGVLPPEGTQKSDSRNFFLSLGLSALFLVLCLALTMHSVVQSHSSSFRMTEPGWISMPAGARSAYLGIHGGTVPVSLLATSTGNSLISFVGQTGNDFLALLRKAELRLPSFFNNSTQTRVSDLLSNAEHLGALQLSAGSSQSSLPVISLSYDSVFSLAAKPEMVQPFGFSENPLRIEGHVSLPDQQVQQPRYHLLVEPEHLNPR